ncbi:MAG: hypothetical protein ACM3IJ_01005 [Candidatus Levyibacteriota bacterium]
MRLLISIIIFTAVVTGFFFWFNSQNPLDDDQDGDAYSGQIKKGMQLGSYHQIRVNDDKIEIGKKNAKVMEPVVKFSKSDSSASLALSYKLPKAIVPVSEDDKIVWGDASQDVYFTTGVSKNTAKIKNYDRYDLDILLKEKPRTNVFTYNLDLSNLEPKLIEKGPSEEFSNSYAFYPQDKTNNKAFHIYRPKVIDAKGKTTWGKLDIHTGNALSADTLSVTVDQQWLSEASYPVIVDPTVGFNFNANHAVVTRLGRFRWKLAVEYEIRNHDGQVLGSDVLITAVRPGETAQEILTGLNGYLKQRAAVWELAQGDFTLYEQSHDRLTSAHFQKSDNADDIKDSFTDARQARKKVLDTASPAQYPDISVTYDEADIMQYPEIAERDPDTHKLTGRKVRSYMASFAVTNEKPGAGVEKLRPNGTGADGTGIDYQVPNSTSHWDKVDDDPSGASDDNTTYIWQGGSFGTQSGTDYYTLEATSLTTETIDSVDGFIRGSFSDPDVVGGSGFRVGVKFSGGTTFDAWQGAEQPWTNRTSSPHLSRPTGGSWVPGNIANTQLIVDLDATPDPCCGAGAGTTQTYLIINYSAAAPTATPTPTPTPVPATVTITSSSLDGFVEGSYTDYATAHSTANYDEMPYTYFYVGQDFYLGWYYVDRGILKFDTSVLGAGAQIVQANLTLTAVGDASNTDFDVEIAKLNWAAQEDYDSNPTSLQTVFSNCISATADNSIWRNTSGMSQNTPYASGNLDTSWINKTGSTYYCLRSSNDRTSSTPTVQEYLFIAASENGTPAFRPTLTIQYYPPLTANFKGGTHFKGGVKVQ